MNEPRQRDNAIPTWALASAGYVLLVVALEFAGSIWGDSPSTGYPGFLVPVVWPTALRVVVFLGAAAGTVAYHLGLRRTGTRGNPVVTALTAMLFTVFAVGIATGQEWAAWH